MAEIREEIRRRAAELGFSLFGITGAQASDQIDFYRRWVSAGYHGEMGYLARGDALERRADPRRSMESAVSAILVGHEYYQEDVDGIPGDPSRGVIARYARGRDYHRVIQAKLETLRAWLDQQLEGGVQGRAYVDTGPLLERELAQRAGLGWFGRNTMLIDPRRGSYFFLGLLLVDAELPADQPFTEDHCGKCRACLDACPTDALLGRNDEGAPVMDARRCISYLTIEHHGPIPTELRAAVGNRVFGCDICQEVCPFSVRFARRSPEPAYAARGPGEPPVGVEPDPVFAGVGHAGTVAPSLVGLMETALDSASWEAFSRGSAIRRAGRDGFGRNVAVALGNWGSPGAVPPLVAALRDASALVRGHAAWALGKVGTDAARQTLVDQRSREGDPYVIDELESALGGLALKDGDRSSDRDGGKVGGPDRPPGE